MGQPYHDLVGIDKDRRGERSPAATVAGATTPLPRSIGRRWPALSVRKPALAAMRSSPARSSELRAVTRTAVVGRMH